MHRFPRWIRLLLSLLVVTISTPAGAATRFHAVVIGNNAVFPGAEEEASAALTPLKYADDDAAAISALVADVASSLHLLTVMDAATQSLYPGLAAAAQPPTLAAVDAAVLAIKAEIGRDRERGDQSVVWFFFSGHGSTSYEGEPGLALADGALTRRYLYDRVLARFSGATVHVLVDACHAESIVRPRDSNAEPVSVAPEVASALLARSTLARFPNVGSLLVSSRDSQAHEWDAIGHGVFTHQVLSALRGAADVNGDRLIEYSEVQAFITAANRSVSDARARASLVVRAPELNRRAPLLDLSAFPAQKAAWLVGVSGSRGVVQVLDDHGRRLVTLHNAMDLSTSLLLPAGVVLYIAAKGFEAELRARPGQVVRFADLKFLRAPARSRGSLASALERGMFRTPFGRGYYEGFTDSASDLVPVPLAPERDDVPLHSGPSPLAAPDRPFRFSAGFGLASSTAQVLGVSHGLRLSLTRARGHGPTFVLDGLTASDGPLTESRATGTFGWLWQTRPSALQLYATARAGAGIIVQEVERESSRSSAVGVGAASTGVASRITEQLGMLAELELAGQLLRRDDAVRMDAVPSAWLGGYWGW